MSNKEFEPRLLRLQILTNIVTLLNAEGTNVFEPDEEDVANVFSNLRGMCQRKVVSNLI
jgi:hypothetical protein